jgi:hypothetical protein
MRNIVEIGSGALRDEQKSDLILLLQQLHQLAAGQWRWLFAFCFDRRGAISLNWAPWDTMLH